MRRELQESPDAELNVLQQLWERGPATIQHLTEALYPRTTDAHRLSWQKGLRKKLGRFALGDRLLGHAARSCLSPIARLEQIDWIERLGLQLLRQETETVVKRTIGESADPRKVSRPSLT
jgi:hypothetical protein